MLKHVQQVARKSSTRLHTPLRIHTSSLQAPMDPRISFSNDFFDAEQATVHESSYREAPVSSDFEFSVRNNTMIPADEVFFKGVMMPLKENSSSKQMMRKMTLRDELLVDDDDEFEDAFMPRMSRSSGWWKDRLGLKRGRIVPKKDDHRNNHVVLERVIEEKGHVFSHDEDGVNTKRAQELLMQEGLSCRSDGV